jgi:XrtJ-associated TM-motif-TM protein
MKNTALVVLGVAFMLLVAAPLRAQTGCTDSPENPTVVLALVGGAGALFSTVRARLRARRDSSKRRPPLAEL